LTGRRYICTRYIRTQSGNLKELGLPVRDQLGYTPDLQSKSKTMTWILDENRDLNDSQMRIIKRI